MISADVSQLREFAVQVGQVPHEMRPKLDGVTERAGLNMKRQLQAEARQSKSFGVIASAISYDTIRTRDSSGVEVGPVKGSPGSLANIAYFGTSRGGGTVPDPRGALDAEAPRFEEYVSRIVEGLL